MLNEISPLAISSSFLSVDTVVDTFLLVSENPDHAAGKLWNVKMSAVSDSFFSPFFPFLCKVRRLNLKRDLLLCCCCNIVQRLMTACQPWFAR